MLLRKRLRRKRAIRNNSISCSDKASLFRDAFFILGASYEERQTGANSDIALIVVNRAPTGVMNRAHPERDSKHKCGWLRDIPAPEPQLSLVAT